MKTATKIITISCLCIIYLAINEKASFHDKHITPVLFNHLPFGLHIECQDAKYGLQDSHKYYLILSGANFRTDSTSRLSNIKLYTVYWNKQMLIAEVENRLGTSFVAIRSYEGDGRTDNYNVVTQEATLEMDNMVALYFPPFYIKYWRLLGSFILLLVVLLGWNILQNTIDRK